ncbi:glycoside hydrolase family 3 N-terminal domain-containing protein [Streptomyces stelliscabiei]|uniref:glycoside hydrolase family 3 N-terminal domain-containing protein n=1 Tax=Streptomyces stelliscabiei TaxID=146820 RepID=UPI002FF2ADA2
MLPYRDPSRPAAERVADLLSRMTLAEKAGQLFHSMLTMNPDGSLTGAADGTPPRRGTAELVTDGHLSHFNLLGQYGVRETAEWVNRLQALAADTRLGIPVTLSTDPRHSFTDHPGTASGHGAFSAWPEPLGLAAIGEPELVERFADTVRREYLAVGFRVALHPQIDLATEPRWSRQSGTFGSSAEVTSALVRAYVRGLQGPRLGPRSVAAMVKHFPAAARSGTARTRTSRTARSRSIPAACATTTSRPSGRPSRRAARR